MWTGGQISPSTTAMWSGIDYAPESLVEPNGWHFRLVAGTAVFKETNPRETRSVSPFTEILAGRQLRNGPLTVKVLAGGTFSATATSPGWLSHLQHLEVSKSRGAKAVAEAWFSLPAQAFLQVDTSLSSVAWTKGVDVRLGLPVLDNLSVGPELSFLNDDRDAFQKTTGLFARYTWATGEASVGGGWVSQDGDIAGNYLRGSFLTRQ